MMENILATSDQQVPQRRFAGYSLATLANFAGIMVAGLWASWATTALVEVKEREVVTVELAGMMGAFVEAEARSGNPPEIMKARVERYLKAVEASVNSLSADGRTVLVAEAVIAGSAPDFTETVRKDVARRLEDEAHVRK
ncbi:TrbI F-type domain-containing protein [Sphingorhabdus pulchriflava]|nr:TrbI F-type domain-containing protein [Sphingorhabdus pulchriflava]